MSDLSRWRALAEPPEPRHTARLQLRRPLPPDLSVVHELHADPRVWEHSPAHVHTEIRESQEMLEAWIAHWDQHGFGYWVVCHADRMIGVGGVAILPGWLRGHDVLNLYYRFKPEAWGQGLASEMAAAALEKAGEAPVVARVVPGNEASARVAIRHGLVRRPELDRDDGLEVYARGIPGQ